MQKLTCLIIFLLFANLVYTQETADKTLTYRNSINIGFIGIQNTISVNYEHLFGERNGIVIGLPVFNIYEGSEQGFSICYRRHFADGMKSAFWGLFLNYSTIKNDVDSPDGNSTNDYHFTYTSLSIGPNVGLRWVEKSGVNLALRLGYGIPLTDFKWIEKPTDLDLANDSEEAIKILSGLDCEITLGFCF